MLFGLSPTPSSSDVQEAMATPPGSSPRHHHHHPSAVGALLAAIARPLTSAKGGRSASVAHHSELFASEGPGHRPQHRPKRISSMKTHHKDSN